MWNFWGVYKLLFSKSMVVTLSSQSHFENLEYFISMTLTAQRTGWIIAYFKERQPFKDCNISLHVKCLHDRFLKDIYNVSSISCANVHACLINLFYSTLSLVTQTFCLYLSSPAHCPEPHRGLIVAVCLCII